MRNVVDPLFGDLSGEVTSSDEHLATGKTAFRRDAEAERRHQRRLAIAELTVELERPPTAEEIELLLGDEDTTPKRVTIEGMYGRDAEEESFGDTRRAERGPTSRRFC